jgi:hypothetical protein
MVKKFSAKQAFPQTRLTYAKKVQRKTSISSNALNLCQKSSVQNKLFIKYAELMPKKFSTKHAFPQMRLTYGKKVRRKTSFSPNTLNLCRKVQRKKEFSQISLNISSSRDQD